jgi:predicted Zn-dependent peptidase
MIRKERLPNGLSLITESMPDVRSVSIGVWLRRGSRNEPARVNGISHFIEHLVFKGTESRSAREIALAMDSVGGQVDAFTSKEYTCFYAKVLDENLPLAVDLLSDIVQRPRFDPTELERERKVVLEEIQMIDDTPDDLIYDVFCDHFFPRHVLGRPIQGTAQTVGSLSRRQLLSFFRSSYRPEHMMVVAAGHLQHRRLANLVRKSFGELERGSKDRRKSRAPRCRHGLVARARKELSQLHLLMGLPAFPENSDRRFTLHVLNAVLGGTISSRLFQKVREERGLVYSVYSAVNAFLDAGFLSVYAATSPRNGAEVVRLVMQELRDLRDRGPAEEEVCVAREHLKGALMLSLESTASRMSNLARQEIYFHRQLSLEETLRRVERVTRLRVQRLARELVDRQRLSLAAVGRVNRLKLDETALKL